MNDTSRSVTVSSVASNWRSNPRYYKIMTAVLILLCSLSVWLNLMRGDGLIGDNSINAIVLQFLFSAFAPIEIKNKMIMAFAWYWLILLLVSLFMNY